MTTEDGYNNGNGISHYIECREGYDRVVDIEQMGAKARDVDGELEGAEFRDEKTKLLFAAILLSHARWECVHRSQIHPATPSGD